MDESWAREEAFLILGTILKKGAYSGIEIRKRFKHSNLKRNDKALVTEIVNGTLRHLIKIDWIIDSFIKIKLEKIEVNIRNILRSGVYQIIYLDRVPDSAVCNESVELAKKYGNHGAAKFVNGVLRNISRGKNDIDKPDTVNKTEFLSIEFSHPEWLVDLWLRNYGYDFTLALLRANNETPPLTIRANKLKTDRNELKNLMDKYNIYYKDGLYNDEAINIRGISSIEDLKLFKNGYFQVQDESSMLVGKIINPKPGDLIIDVCSAPGGKATHLAELMSNKGKIISRDVYKHKLELIEDNCKRLGITIIETQLFDAKDIDKSILGMADSVLVDAPCSGLGLVRRKPDLRWSKKEEDLNKLPQLQLSILKSASLYVKKAGVLIYSTCTLNDNENKHVVEKFLKTSDDFMLDRIDEFLPKNICASNKGDGFLELYPHIHGTDGFFIARMIKK